MFSLLYFNVVYRVFSDNVFLQGRIKPVSLWEAISVIFGIQVSLRVHYCKRDEVYFTTLLWQNNGRQNGLISRTLFSKLYKIMVKRVIL